MGDQHLMSVSVRKSLNFILNSWLLAWLVDLAHFSSPFLLINLSPKCRNTYTVKEYAIAI
jgi:hypothetical protein